MPQKKYRIHALETVIQKGPKTGENTDYSVEDLSGDVENVRKMLGVYPTLEEAAEDIVANTLPNEFEIVSKAEDESLHVYREGLTVLYDRGLTLDEKKELSRQLLHALSGR